MEKDFHLSLSTHIKLIRRTGLIAACDHKRNKFVFAFVSRSWRLDLWLSHCTMTCYAHA